MGSSGLLTIKLIRMKKYDIIYADPPWQYDSGRSLATKSLLDGVSNEHYGTMTIDDLKKLPVSKIANENSLCFMWLVSPKVDFGIEVLKAWGFTYVTIAFIWHKQRTNPGYYTMSECEICVVGKKGKIPKPRGSRNERQFLSELRTKHSKKPDEIRNRISRMFPEQTKIELFARQRHDGWDAWGNRVVHPKVLHLYTYKPSMVFKQQIRHASLKTKRKLCVHAASLIKRTP
jgi:N6-adenosine-specific RNA methylase IME4